MPRPEEESEETSKIFQESDVYRWTFVNLHIKKENERHIYILLTSQAICIHRQFPVLCPYCTKQISQMTKSI